MALVLIPHGNTYQFLLTTESDGAIDMPQLALNILFATLLGALVAQVPRLSRRSIIIVVTTVCLVAGGWWWCLSTVAYATKCEWRAQYLERDVPRTGLLESKAYWMEAAKHWRYILQFDEANKCLRNAGEH